MEVLGLLTAVITVLGPPLVQAWTARQRTAPDRAMSVLRKDISDASAGTPTDRAVLLDRVLDAAKTRRRDSGR